MTNLLSDLRYAIRTLCKRPGFLVAAATVLSLGIGANTAIFSLVNAFLLKPLALRTKMLEGSPHKHGKIVLSVGN